MNLQRRQFLSKTFEVGWFSALISLGMSYKIASSFAGLFPMQMDGTVAAGCGSCGDTIIAGNQTDHASSQSMDTWWAVKVTASSSNDCVCRFKFLLSADSDASADNTFGYAVYDHDAGNDRPDGSSILSSGTTLVSITGDAQTVTIDFSSVISLTNSTTYWLAGCNSTGSAKIEMATSGGTRIVNLSGETTPGTPPTDWSGEFALANYSMAMAATY